MMLSIYSEDPNHVTVKTTVAALISFFFHWSDTVVMDGGARRSGGLALRSLGSGTIDLTPIRMRHNAAFCLYLHPTAVAPPNSLSHGKWASEERRRFKDACL